jgi:hypothetical protein
MTSDWYYSKRAAATGQQAGPFTWEQLYSQAQAGQFGPDDLVWNPQLPDWLAASQIPGLITGASQPAVLPIATRQPAAAQAGAAYPAAYPAAYQPAAQPTKDRGSYLLAWLIPLIALVLVGSGLGAYFGFFRGGDDETTAGGNRSTVSSEVTSSTTVGGIGMGKAEVKLPDPAKLVQTEAYGEVPANQIGVVLADGQSKDVAKDLAKTLGGSVVGEIEFMNAYQIETPGSTETDLTAALDQAKATPGVEIAFPNVQTADDTEIWGVRQSPLNDPAYGGGRSAGFDLIGAPKAWAYIRGAGLPLSDVHVGLVDDGIYRKNGEYDGDVNVYFPDSDAGELSDPNKDTNDKNHVTVTDPTGSHGTMVSGLIGGDPGNGGTTGVASPVLGNHLTISMVNHYSGTYGNTPVANPDPNDPTVVTWSDGHSYSFGSLVAITKEIEAGAKVINCSWGNTVEDEDAQSAAAYRKFFEQMSADHPDVLFVCSAGNDGKSRDGTKRFPSGQNLPNMITVGNVMNDGTTADSSNKVNTTPGQEFEVTLAAPGHDVVQGVDANGNPITDKTDVGNGNSYEGGTSAATPQVSAAAALMLSLDPELTAAEIKQILSDTARPGPAEVGGKILAVDQAVLEIINQQRDSMGLPAVTGEDLEKGGVIDAVATSQDEDGQNVWSVKAIVESLPSAEGAEITITATTGTKIEGQTTQKITAPGDIAWVPVKIPNETAQITITRSDSGASTVISFEPIDLNGDWEGTFTFGSFNIDQSAVPSDSGASSGGGLEGCDLSVIGAVLAKMQNHAFPMTMDITVDDEGNGTAVTVIDMSAFTAELAAEYPEGEVTSTGNEPQTFNFTFSGNTLTFQLDESSGAGGSMTGVVRRQGEDLVVDGIMTSSGAGFSIAATWTVTKQE